jgi:hypothetical protein
VKTDWSGDAGDEGLDSFIRSVSVSGSKAFMSIR